MIQSGGFLGRLLGPLLKTGLPFIKNVIKPLAKRVLIPLGLTAIASTADAGIHKKNLGSGHNRHSSSVLHNTMLIISDNEMEDIFKIVKSLEVQNEVKEQKGRFPSMLLGTLGASLLGNILTVRGINRAGKGRGINRAGKGREINRAGEGIVRAGYGRCSSKIDF